MKTIKCPKCGEQFSVEETFYNAINCRVENAGKIEF